MENVIPIIVQAGRVRDKHLRKLELGEGRIAEDVRTVMTMVEQDPTIQREGRMFVPIVVYFVAEEESEGLPAAGSENAGL